jgi:hypothetical protein
MFIRIKNTLIFIFLAITLVLILYIGKNTSFKFLSRATYRKANILIDVKKYTGPLSHNWKALAQGGEEQGVRMLENVVYQTSALQPRYIRLDHIYDFYNVVKRNNAGHLEFDWTQLDKTVCDIYHIGAKPFFSLGYMPPEISLDGSLISQPKDWQEWQQLVKSTVEHYSGKNTRLCGGVYGEWMNNIYYEVWNEPDLESFGKWSLYGGEKDYKAMYYYSSKGAQEAANVYHFYLGGPVTTKAYQNWFLRLLDYIEANNLRIDFISWHHYSQRTDDYKNDVNSVHSWLSRSPYQKYKNLPLIISEWGFDSNPNPISETNVGAAHTLATIRYLIEEKVEMAFAFDIKDGPEPRWGIFTNSGEAKPRYNALKLLNVLYRHQLYVQGEGSFVKGIASFTKNKYAVVLVNYDLENKNTESVPFAITNLVPGNYTVTTTSLNGQVVTEEVQAPRGVIQKTLLMPPNSAYSIEINKK